jgi:hypothetical protein
MKSTNENYYKMEAVINARLAATPADKRPEMSTRRKIVSVAYQAAGFFQATDSTGNVESMTASAFADFIA